MIFTVPCVPAGSALWTQRTALDGTDYLMTFDWNQRAGAWSFALADSEGVPIRGGAMLLAGALPLRGVTDPRRPPGELILLDTLERADLDPGFADLGGRFQLLYADAAELGR